MEINRNNYEDFFILYIDDELDCNDKILVDNFLHSNSDLKVEFNLLKQSKLTNPPLLNFNKSSLFKFNTNTINQFNYQEKFILYIDNELGNKEKEEVENYTLQNPELQSQFLSLKAAKLYPEKIEYPYKSNLLKKDRKPIVFYLYKPIAIAASIILLVVAIWLYNFSNKISTSNELALNNTKTTITENEKQLLPVLKEKDQQTSLREDNVQNKVTQPAKLVKSKVINTEKLPNPNKTYTTENNDFYSNKDEGLNIVVINKKTIQPYSTTHLDNNFVEDDISINTLAINSSITEENTKPIYKFLDIHEDDNTNISIDKTVSIGSFKIKKNKLKNIFNKASNAIGNPIKKITERVEVATL